MDVGCPSCKTEYELEDARVPDGGLTVKCTSCGHVFRVKRKSLAVTMPATPHEAGGAVAVQRARAGVLPPPPPPREWKVRQPTGNLYVCRELTTLQKWIIEGKVTRHDEISLTGDTWKRLGNIPELASFFQIVDDAAKGRAWEAQRGSGIHAAVQTMPALASLPSLPPIPTPAPGHPTPAQGSPTPVPGLDGRASGSATPAPRSEASRITATPNIVPAAHTPISLDPGGQPRLTETWREPGFSVALPRTAAPAPPGTPLTETRASLRQTLKDPHFAAPAPPKPEAETLVVPPRAPAPPPPPPPAPATGAWEPSDSQLARAAQGGPSRARWLAPVVLGVGTAVLLAWYFDVPLPGVPLPGVPRPSAPASPPTPTALTPPTPAPPAPEPAAEDAGVPPLAVAPAAPAALVDAGAPPEAAAAPALAPVDAGAPEADAGTPAGADAGVAKKPSFEALLAQADRLRDRDKAEAALDLYGRAHELKPGRVEPLTGRGLTLLDMGNEPAAQAAFDQALRLNPRHGPAIMGMAESLRVQGKNARAVVFYQRYLEVAPDGSEATVARNNIERLKDK